MAFNKAKAMQEAEKYVIQGKIPQAIKEYARILEKEPSDVTLLNTIGDLYFRQKNTSEALSHFRQLADAYVKEGFTVKAIAIYKKIIKIESNSVEPLLKIAELYVLQGLSREARDHYALAVEFYKKKNQTDKAIETFRKIVALDPDNTNYRTRYADFCVQAGKKEEAARAFLEVAEVALKRDDRATAENAVKKAAQLDQKSSQLQLVRAHLAFAKGDMGEVESILNSAPSLKTAPKGRDLLLKAYLAAHKVEAAEGLVMDVFHTNHDDFTPVSSFAAMCVERGRYDSALKALAASAEAMIARKNTGPLMDSLRQIWSKNSSHIPTLELLHEVSERTADEFTLPEVLEALGNAYARSGALEKAEAVFRKLVSRQPENHEYAALLNEVLQQQGKEAATAPVPADFSTVEADLVFEGAPGLAAPLVDAEQATAVKEALENSDLFLRYGLVDKAIAELEKALETYPDQVDIHRRILEICHRSLPERAKSAAETLARIHKQRSDTGESAKYAELARKLAAGVPPEEFVLPEAPPGRSPCPKPRSRNSPLLRPSPSPLSPHRPSLSFRRFSLSALPSSRPRRSSP